MLNTIQTQGHREPINQEQLSNQIINKLVHSITVPSLASWGDATWLDAHVVLEQLALQSTLNVRMGTEESVSDAILEFDKVPELIHILARSRTWKLSIYPLVKSHLANNAVFIGYSLIHQESLLLNLLQTVVFKSPSIESAGDALIDLIDMACQYISNLNGPIEIPNPNSDKDALVAEALNENQEEALTKYCIKEEFDSAWQALACICHMTHHTDKLPVCATARLMDTHDIIYQLAHVLSARKWELKTNTGDVLVYIDGGWAHRTGDDAKLVTKAEGLAWMALSNLLHAPDTHLQYQITAHRRTALLQLVQRFDTNPTLMTQLPFLESTLRKLLHLQLSPDEVSTVSSMRRLVQAIPVYTEPTISQIECQAMARTQIQSWTLEANKSHSLRLSNVYDLGMLESLLEAIPRCGTCGAEAEHKCSKCLAQWYCSRKCQVNGWKSHKSVCAMIAKARET